MTTDASGATRTGATLLVDAMLAEGLDTLFALPGAQLDPLFSALWERRDAFRLFIARHEQGAAYMAFGAARSSGRAHPYLVVPGPGWLNTTAALATAYAAHAPVVSISGQIPRASLGRGFGEMHEIRDQLGMAANLTQAALRVEAPGSAADALRELVARLRSADSRPVHLEMPLDVMSESASPSTSFSAPFAASEPLPDVSAAVALLNRAVRPMIFVGSGALGCRDEVRSLAERLQAPVAAFRMGRGVLDYRHRLAVPWPAAHRLWRDVDVVLAIGTRLDFPRRMWGVDERLRIIRIDHGPAGLDELFPPTVSLPGDAAKVVRALLAALPTRTAADRTHELSTLRSEVETDMRTRLAPQMAYLTAIRDALPESGFFVDELTQVGYTAWAWFPTYFPRHYVSSGYQSTLGYGFATALGVQVAHPHDVVIAITGDGGFLFNASELATAARYALPVITILFRDERFGNVHRIQQERYGGRMFGSDLKNPDFVKLAESFDVHAARVGSAPELARLLPKLIERRKPALVEVRVDELPSPWPFIIMPKIRG